MPRNPALPYVWMLCGSFSFALMSATTHTLGSVCDWQVIAIARSGLALAFTALLAIVAGSRLVFWRPRILWLRSTAGSISLVSGFYALTRLPISDVLTLTNMFPIWVALLSWPLLKERPSPSVWMAVLSGVAGVALIQQLHFAEGNFASVLALFSSFSTAIAMLGLHRLHGVDARAVVVHFSGVSLLFCCVALFLFPSGEWSGNDLGPRSLTMLVAVGATATIGQLFLTKAFAAGPPARVSVVGLSQIVFALILDWVFLDRTFTTMSLAGIALVVAPTAWMLRHPPRLLKPTAEIGAPSDGEPDETEVLAPDL